MLVTTTVSCGRYLWLRTQAAAQDVPYSERAEARKRRFGDAATSGAAAGRQEGDRWGHDKYEPADSVRGHKRRY